MDSDTDTDTETLTVPCDACGTPAPLVDEDLHLCPACTEAGVQPSWGATLWEPGQVDWVEL